jgi:hypothetical protein
MLIMVDVWMVENSCQVRSHIMEKLKTNDNCFIYDARGIYI